jgi:hypothetical protein
MAPPPGLARAAAARRVRGQRASPVPRRAGRRPPSSHALAGTGTAGLVASLRRCGGRRRSGSGPGRGAGPVRRAERERRRNTEGDVGRGGTEAERERRRGR